MEGVTFIYDGSFEGLLSVIFESYRLQARTQRITPMEDYSEQLFAQPIEVKTNVEWVERVRKGISRKATAEGMQLLYRCFLSEVPDIEMLIYYFVRRAMNSQENILHNYRDPKILRLHQINKKIGREVHRMHAFVRFQKTKDDIYTALIEPDFNVLPLIGEHFEQRYPGQNWLIYDSRRHYGIFYETDRASRSFITFHENDHTHLKKLTGDLMTADEPDYQELWKSYFNSVNIPERNNLKLHLQHVPKRYWKYLVEKW